MATIRADDKDLDSIVEYSLVSGDKSTFNIDSRTGDLSLLRTVDREEEESFRSVKTDDNAVFNCNPCRLVVRAEDGAHQTDISVLITVS